jgi:hypothetical protein
LKLTSFFPNKLKGENAMKIGIRPKILCVLASILFLISCGGGGGSPSLPTETGAMVNGVASKGLISGGTVKVYAIDSNGQKGSLLGSTTTDSNGHYSIEIIYDGPVLVEITGGTYIDEATGETKDLAEPLRAALPHTSGDVDVAVTPLTEIAVRIAESSGSMDSTKIGDANDLISQILGDDIISTLPTDCEDTAEFSAASEAEKNYALLLAAISQMSETSGQELPDVLDEFEEDLADMEMDQTSDDLLTGIDDFLNSEDNDTGVTEAPGLVDVVQDVADNGFDPTYHFGGGYLQFRTNEDSSGNAYRGFFSASQSGLLLQTEDIASITVRDANNTEVSISNSGVWAGSYYSYNCRSTPCNETGPYMDGGLYGTLDTLSTGVYQIELQTTDGNILTTEMYYPGQVALPVVDSSLMQAQWSNGDLVLSWTNPTYEVNWLEVDQMRVVLFDADNNDVVFVSVNVTDETVTLPAALVNKAAVLYNGSGISSWQVQTRAYDEYGMNYARGNSNRKDLPYSVGYSYLQYRTFEDSSNNQYRVWMEVRTDGGLASAGDFTNFRVLDSSGNVVTPSNTPSLWIDPFPYLIYNCITTPCTISSPYQESGFSARYDNLPAGNYTLLADAVSGTLTRNISFPGIIELPVVTSASMQFQTEGNGDLTLSWTNPTNEPNWSSVDQLRVILTSDEGNYILWVKVNPADNTLTIPNSIKNDAEALGGGQITGYTIQTRVYDENNLNISRGISSYSIPN